MDDDDLAAAMRALGHPARLSILRLLAHQGVGQCCCTDVMQCVPLAQSTVSQHIKVLLEAGLLEREPRGTRNCYSVRTDKLRDLERAAAALFADLGRAEGVVPLSRAPSHREPA